jgi:hypothetical protein
MSPTTAAGWFLALLLVANLLRMRARRRKRRLLAPALVYDTGVRSAWRTPGRRRPHRGF